MVERARVVKGRVRDSTTLRTAAEMLSGVVPGVFEEVAARTNRAGHRAAPSTGASVVPGSSAPAFDTIVAAGPNAALPHARPGERTLTEGDLVVLDFGGVYDSYCVDLTRTVSVGRGRCAGARGL